MFEKRKQCCVCERDIASYLAKVNGVVVVSGRESFATQFLAHAQDMILSGTHK
jgi:hypothetical protein